MTSEELKLYPKTHQEGDIVYFIIPLYDSFYSYGKPGGILELHYKSVDSNGMIVSEDVNLLIKETISENIEWYGSKNKISNISCLFETKEEAQKYFDKLKRQYKGKIKRYRTRALNKIKMLEKEIESLKKKIKTCDDILKCI